MGRHRQKRKGRVRLRHNRAVAAAVLGIGACALVVAVIAASSESGPSAALEAAETADEQPSPRSGSMRGPTAASSMAAPLVEIPEMQGKPVGQARIVAGALGITLDVVEDPEEASDVAGDERMVLAQTPEAGAVVDASTPVVLTVPVGSTLTAGASALATVCIDPGHQARSNTDVEAIGPGAGETKVRVSGGGQGVMTGIPEHELALQLSLALKAELEARGVEVVMTRTSNDVDLSNAERARAANESAADLLVRVHCGGSLDANASGILTVYPAENEWTAPICGESEAAAATIQDGMVASTGALSRGTESRDGLAGFNWAEMPVVLVEGGLLTNPIEDRLLSSKHYQEKLARGMADGIIEYLAGE